MVIIKLKFCNAKKSIYILMKLSGKHRTTFGLLNMLADGSSIIFISLSANIKRDVMLFGFCCIFILLIFNRL